MILETEGLSKRFGEVLAVDSLDLQMEEGEILCLLGPNGAGKTTTVRMLASILRPTAGHASVSGYDVVSEARKVRHIVGLLTEFPGLYLRMALSDYLDFFGELQGLSPAERRRRSRELMEAFGLEGMGKLRLSALSKGMRQKVALIRAMLHDPRILFLDEPTSAMDPHSAKMVRDSIVGLKREARTILVCTHNLAEAEALADRIAIIKRGQMVACGSIGELKQQLLGPPSFEMRLACPLDGLTDLVRALVEVEAHGPAYLRYRTAAPQEVNPRIVRRVTEMGAEVVTLSEVPRSLEEVFIRTVEEPDA